MLRAVRETGLRYDTCAGPHIWRNRNRLISDIGWWSYYLFWDADVSVANPLEAIGRLILRQKPIIGAAYEMRRDDGLRSYCAAVDGKGHLSMASTGLHAVSWVGAGFLLVEGNVFTKIEKPWFRHEFVGDDQTPEDIGFCMNALRSGFRSYVDCDVVVQHHLE